MSLDSGDDDSDDTVRSGLRKHALEARMNADKGALRKHPLRLKPISEDDEVPNKKRLQNSEWGQAPVHPHNRSCGIEASWYMLLSVKAGIRRLERPDKDSPQARTVLEALRINDVKKMQSIFDAMCRTIRNHDGIFPQTGNPEAMDTWNAVARHSDQVCFTTARLTWCPGHPEAATYDEPVRRSYVPLDTYRTNEFLFHDKDMSQPSNVLTEFFAEYPTNRSCKIQDCRQVKLGQEHLLDRLGMHVMIQCEGTPKHKDILATVDSIKGKTLAIPTVASDEVPVRLDEVSAMMVSPRTVRDDEGHFQAIIWFCGTEEDAIVKDSNSSGIGVGKVEVYDRKLLKGRRDRIAGVLLTVQQDA